MTGPIVTKNTTRYFCASGTTALLAQGPASVTVGLDAEGLKARAPSDKFYWLAASLFGGGAAADLGGGGRSKPGTVVEMAAESATIS